ncbi:unnamed protein product, partial [Discosporangium mesarthrocarpum]
MKPPTLMDLEDLTRVLNSDNEGVLLKGLRKFASQVRHEHRHLLGQGTRGDGAMALTTVSGLGHDNSEEGEGRTTASTDPMEEEEGGEVADGDGKAEQQEEEEEEEEEEDGSRPRRRALGSEGKNKEILKEEWRGVGE